MSEIISISYDDRAVMAALDRIIRSAADLSPALKSIGETLAASTKARFGGLPRTGHELAKTYMSANYSFASTGLGKKKPRRNGEMRRGFPGT